MTFKRFVNGWSVRLGPLFIIRASGRTGVTFHTTFGRWD